jgi:ADP-L-glycero-D-manno-heptose 6-epimerase
LIVITGAAGFIGSNLLASLEARKVRPLIACDWLGSSDKWRNLAKREIADLVAPENLLAYLDRRAAAVDLVFHMGAISSTSETDAERLATWNLRFTLDLWRWCAAHAKRFVYASSAATYGDGAAGFEDGQDRAALARLRPLNPYGWSKHAADRAIAVSIADGSPRPRQTVGLKFFNVYGPNEYHKGDQMSVAVQLYRQIASGAPARLFASGRSDIADGAQARDFVWIDDCLAVMEWLMDRPDVNGLFNLGTGQARTFRELAEAVFAALGKSPAIEFVPTPEALLARYQ